MNRVGNAIDVAGKHRPIAQCGFEHNEAKTFNVPGNGDIWLNKGVDGVVEDFEWRGAYFPKENDPFFPFEPLPLRAIAGDEIDVVFRGVGEDIFNEPGVAFAVD